MTGGGVGDVCANCRHGGLLGMEMKAGTRSGLLTLRFLQVNGEAERVAEFIIVGPQF